MLHQLYNPPRHQPFILACSGGVDSMAIADFYKRGNKNFSVAYFNHGTPQSLLMQNVVVEWAINHRVPFRIGYLTNPKPTNLSPEEHWRNERYAWLHSFGLPVITCHHLNDAAEGYLFGAMHGCPKFIAPVIEDGDKKIYRPFLTNTKQDLIDWCRTHAVPWFEDISNNDVHFPRNRIRHNILPEVLKVNPGFLKVIRKKYLENYGKQ